MRRKQAATPAQRNGTTPCSNTERFLSTPRQSPKQSVPDSGGQSDKATAGADQFSSSKRRQDGQWAKLARALSLYMR